MLDKLLNLIGRYYYLEFSYKNAYLIKYNEGYEIASINSYSYLKDIYLELSKYDFLDVSIRDFITPNKELKKIINKHKLGFIPRLFANTNMFRKPIFDSYALFNDQDFFNFFEKKGAYLDLDIHVRTTNGFIDRFFYCIESELGKGEDKKDQIGNELYEEINKTLNGKKTYSGDIEIAYKLDDFIKSNNRYVYFLLKDLEYNEHLKLKNVIIKEGKIKFIICDLTEIDQKLFSNSDSIMQENLEISYLATEKGCNLVKGDKIATFLDTDKPFKIVKRFFKDGKNKPMNLSSLYKLLYGEPYQKSLHESNISSIENVIKGINKKVKPLNNGKQYFSFKGQVLRKIEK